MLHADNISKKIASLKGMFFSLITPARDITLAGWHPVLKARSIAEKAMTSGWTLFIPISSSSAAVFSQSPEVKKLSIQLIESISVYPSCYCLNCQQ